MTEFAIPSWDTPTIPVTDAGKPFPVRRIYCVGRNYAAHAREMGHDQIANHRFSSPSPPTRSF